MEQSYACKCHYHAELVASLDNIIVTNRTARLSHIGYTALSCSLYVVSKGEESVGAKAHTLK